MARQVLHEGFDLAKPGGDETAYTYATWYAGKVVILDQTNSALTAEQQAALVRMWGAYCDRALADSMRQTIGAYLDVEYVGRLPAC